VGHGAYGIVYKCMDPLLKSLVAVKLVRGEKDKENIRKEADVMAMFRNHPNVMNIHYDIPYSFDSEDRGLALVMDYADTNLSKVIRYLSSIDNFSLSPVHLQTMVLQLLSGLDFIHSKGVVHCDLKPDNILMDHTGILRISDFGMACNLSRMPMGSKGFCGQKNVVTVNYRAPELLCGSQHYGMEIDVWSLGCVVYELACLKMLAPGPAPIDDDGNSRGEDPMWYLAKVLTVLDKPSVPESYRAFFKDQTPLRCNTDNTQPVIKVLSELSHHYSPAFVAFLSRMLEMDPGRRSSTKQLLSDTWLLPAVRRCSAANSILAETAQLVKPLMNRLAWPENFAMQCSYNLTKISKNIVSYQIFVKAKVKQLLKDTAYEYDDWNMVVHMSLGMFYNTIGDTARTLLLKDEADCKMRAEQFQ
jgi:serine/threonine protein kinase